MCVYKALVYYSLTFIIFILTTMVSGFSRGHARVYENICADYKIANDK